MTVGRATRAVQESLLAKLRSRARALHYPPNLILQLYLCERFLARISRSDQQSKLILKGGLNLYCRQPNAARPTLGIDFAASTISAALESEIASVAAFDLGDYVDFDTASLTVNPLLEGASQDGVRLDLTAHVGSVHAKLALNITSGNAIHPAPVWLEIPSLLELETGEILGCRLETVFSEKLAVIVELGQATTRLQDFYDLHQMVTRDVLSLKSLREAIKHTFAQRSIELTGSALLLARLRQDGRLSQRWKAFLAESGMTANPDFALILEPVIAFVSALEQPEA